MSTMKVRNRSLAGLTITMPDGSQATFDGEGVADVGEACGINEIPGYEVIEGTPRVQITARHEVKQADGPQVVCTCPPDLAGATIGCPDGHTTAVFGANRQAVVPNTCGLDQLPGFTFTTLQGEPVAGQFEPPAAEPVRGGVLQGGMEPALPPPARETADKGKKGSKMGKKKSAASKRAAEAGEGAAAKQRGKPAKEARTAAREDAQVSADMVAQDRVQGNVGPNDVPGSPADRSPDVAAGPDGKPGSAPVRPAGTQEQDLYNASVIADEAGDEEA